MEIALTDILHGDGRVRELHDHRLVDHVDHGARSHAGAQRDVALAAPLVVLAVVGYRAVAVVDAVEPRGATGAADLLARHERGEEDRPGHHGGGFGHALAVAVLQTDVPAFVTADIMDRVGLVGEVGVLGAVVPVEDAAEDVVLTGGDVTLVEVGAGAEVDGRDRCRRRPASAPR